MNGVGRHPGATQPNLAMRISICRPDSHKRKLIYEVPDRYAMMQPTQFRQAMMKESVDSRSKSDQGVRKDAGKEVRKQETPAIEEVF